MRRSLPFLICLLAASPAISQPLASHSITDSAVECVDGLAAGYPCKSVTLMSKLAREEYTNADELNDVWGWAHQDSGREFALAGTGNAVAFIEVTDPENPVFLGWMATHGHDGSASWWRDIKVYKDHMFVTVDVINANGLQVFNLLELLEPMTMAREFHETYHYDGFGQAHNVAINEATGFAYVTGAPGDNNMCPWGIHIVDIRDPAAPTYAGCYIDQQTGNRGFAGYIHDAQCFLYDGPDEDYRGKEICMAAGENGISIADVTDKSQPSSVAYATYPGAAYVHQGWVTPDHKYYIQNDELDELSGATVGTTTLIWDIAQLDDPVLFGEYIGATNAVDHNLYVLDEYVYLANYAQGMRILDIGDISNPVEIAYFDTHPVDDATDFDGAWTAYPYLPSGHILVNSYPEGLFVIRAEGLRTVTASEQDAEVPDAFVLSSAYPNPFNPVTTITLRVPVSQTVDVRVYDMLGREVALLHHGILEAGPQHTLRFTAHHLQSGSFLIRASGDSHLQTQIVTLLKQ